MYRYLMFEFKPFPVNLHVYVGNDMEILQDIKNTFNGYDILNGMASNAVGVCASEDILCGNYIIYVKSKKYLLHESIHCIDDMMEFLLITSSEFRAYYTDYLYKHLSNDKNYKIINKKR